MAEELLRVEHLVKYFPGPSRSQVRVIEDINFNVFKGETLGIVGESGCGKSTTARLLLRMIPPTSGRILFKGEDISKLSGSKIRALRREMQMVFQDPFASLNPRMCVADIIAEPLVCCTDMTAAERSQRVEQLLCLVGLDANYSSRYPHEFSGGQRQRICIAHALALNPQLIICDEAVSALDVSIRSQVLNLLAELQQKLGLTYIFISHDLSVVKHISDRICVMYLGKIVELAEKNELFSHPLHPYTQALLSAIPVPDPLAENKRILLEGDIPSPVNPPSGCRFQTRCFEKQRSRPLCTLCDSVQPEWVQVRPGHFVACHQYTPAVQPEP